MPSVWNFHILIRSIYWYFSFFQSNGLEEPPRWKKEVFHSCLFLEADGCGHITDRHVQIRKWLRDNKPMLNICLTYGMC